MAEKCSDAADQMEKLQEQKDAISASHWELTNSISLQPYESKVYALSAYCVDFPKQNPSNETKFNVAPASDPQTRQLFSYLRTHQDDYSVVAVQLATWAINGNVSAREIEHKFDFEKKDKDDACRLLTLAGLGTNGKKLCMHE